MKAKSVQFVTAPQETHWVGDGFRVNNFISALPGLAMTDMDPFILLDYNQPMEVAPTDAPRGVGVHPHRGFETVTLALKGRVEHHDSHGGGGVIGEGDVQWMTAARGVLHKEHYAADWARQGGTFHMVQLWVNLPARDKMGEPAYQAITNDRMGRYTSDDGRCTVEVVAGEYRGVCGPATTHSPMHLFRVRLAAGGRAEFSFPSAYNTALLVLEGSVRIDGRTAVPTHNLAKFAHDGEAFTLEATDDALVLVMSGEPLREPIAAYGPFVMNTRAEIQAAFDDFNRGEFGQLAD